MANDYKGPGTGIEDTYTPDNLHAGDFPIVTEDGVIEDGQDLPRGAVLGKITASGKLVLSESDAGDGSETPYAVLAVDVDADGADVTAPVYLTGEFNERALTIGTGHTADDIRDGLREKGIFIKGSVAAG